MAKKGKKGGKKGKKKAGPDGPQQVTTTQIIHDRTKMLCPRMGDVYSRSMNMEIILEVCNFIALWSPIHVLQQDVAEKYIKKVLERKLDHISLASMKLSKFPVLSNTTIEVACLTDLNISKNNLFNGDEVFLVSNPLHYLFIY